MPIVCRTQLRNSSSQCLQVTSFANEKTCHDWYLMEGAIPCVCCRMTTLGCLQHIKRRDISGERQSPSLHVVTLLLAERGSPRNRAPPAPRLRSGIKTVVIWRKREFTPERFAWRACLPVRGRSSNQFMCNLKMRSNVWSPCQHHQRTRQKTMSADESSVSQTRVKHARQTGSPGGTPLTLSVPFACQKLLASSIFVV